MDMYGFNRIIDGFRKTSQYQKWAAYYELISDLKRNILTARRIWAERKGEGGDGCSRCHSPINGKHYITAGMVLCPFCYSAYRYIRPTLESCADPYCTIIPVYDWKDWDTFVKDNPLDDGWHWEYDCGVLLKVRGFEQKRVWLVSHPAVMRGVISAGSTPP